MLRPREEKKKTLRAFKTKGIIITALVLWGISAVSLCVNSWKMFNRQENVVNAFSHVIYSDVTASVSANGYYGNMELSETGKYIILEDIAKRIGINRYEISSDDRGATTLSQNSVNGKVMLKIITAGQEADGQIIGQNQYLCVNIELNNHIAATDTYRQLVEDIFKDYMIDTNVNVNLSGNVAGRLKADDMQEIKKTLMEETKGKAVAEKYTEDIYTVYGYDKDIDDYIAIGKQKVNINITMSYDEINDCTRITLATPINNQDY
ncbi:MAG: YwmB family TATA-box binding protein [Eubacteriales bacterium]|nr:YwmB family TATA-box binding protein [Eubacteriales bacterium]